MKLDDPNHDPSDPLVCKENLPQSDREALISDITHDIQYATLESYLRTKGWTNELLIHREILIWRKVYEDQEE